MKKNFKRNAIMIAVTAFVVGGSAFAQSLPNYSTVLGVDIRANNDGTNNDENLTLRAGNGGAGNTASSFINLYSGGNADIYGVGSVNIVGNMDNSAGTEGVFIRSNATNPQAFVYLGTDGAANLGSTGTTQIGGGTVNVVGTTANLSSTTTNITGATNISGATTITGTAALNNGLQVSNGTTTLNSGLTVSNGAAISGGANITGATNINNTANAGVTNIGNAQNAVTMNGSSIGLTGATTINAAGGANTTIGTAGGNSINTLQGATNSIQGSTGTNINTAADMGNVTLGNGANTVSINGANNTMSGTNTITGTTTINAAAGNTSNTTVGTSTNAVNISGGTNTVGNASTSVNKLQGASNTLQATTNAIIGTTNHILGAVNNFGTGDNASVNTLGNVNAATRVDALASNARLQLAQDTAKVQVQTGENIYGLAVTPTVATLTGVTTTILGTTATNINTTGTGNPITVGHAGNTTNLNSATNNIGVNAYATVNNIGTGSASSTNNVGNAVATTTVHTQAGNAQMNLANNQASLTVPSAATGVSNGVAVNTTQSAMTGGDATPTRMTLTDNAATFSRVSNGAPVTVTGVADGRADFDAVNVRQFAGAIASVAAQANIPALAAGQERAIGLGVGSFMGRSGFAMGMSFRGEGNAMYKLSVSTGLNGGGSQTTVGAGAAWAF